MILVLDFVNCMAPIHVINTVIQVYGRIFLKLYKVIQQPKMVQMYAR